MITARQTTADEADLHIANLALAELRCTPDYAAAPPTHMVRQGSETGNLFVAERDGNAVAYALIWDTSGEIKWMTHLGPDHREQMIALCSAVKEAVGVAPWGRVGNAQLRAAIAHPDLHADPDDPTLLTWRG